MNEWTDQQLLRGYAGNQSESAFTELVRRHIDFVYSAALRMVCDADLAKDVSQNTFLALAQAAPKLVDRPVLSGWLHRTAQNLAAKVVRSDVRRRAHEQEAAAMNELLSAEPDANWEHIAPHLDTALGELSESDRDALLLRYFERKSAREMAQTLGISDDAAQKRVSRAVERLREFFAKRGITVGASGLVVVISANAVQAAPLGLATTISSAAVMAATGIATAATTVVVAMTTLQKVAVTAAISVAVGAGIYQARQVSTLSNEVQLAQEQQATLSGQAEQLRREREDVSARLADLQLENEQLNNDRSELFRLRSEVEGLRKDSRELAALKEANEQIENDPDLRKWLARVDQLKKHLADTPGASIPEIQLASPRNWLWAANKELDTDEDYRKAMASIRSSGQSVFAKEIKVALRKYIVANQGQFPTEVSQLSSYFESPVDETILQRYGIVPGSKYRYLTEVEADWLIVTTTTPDPAYDQRAVIGINQCESNYFENKKRTERMKAKSAILAPAIKAYSEANYGLLPYFDMSELIPYVTTDEQRAALEQELPKDKKSKDSRPANATTP